MAKAAKKAVEQELVTVTLGHDEDNPDFTICPGHVDPDTFAKAWAAEGWSDTDVETLDLTHEYWIPTAEGGYSRSEKGAPGAVPVTVMSW